MNSVEIRRELRRQKILQNSELRKEKIFGITLAAENNEISNANTVDGNLVNGEMECMQQEELNSELSSRGIYVPLKPVHIEDSEQMEGELKKTLGELSSKSMEHLQEPFESNREVNSDVFNNFTSRTSPLLHSRLSGNSILSSTRDMDSIELRSPNYSSIFLNHPLFPCFLSFVVCLLITLNWGGVISNSVIIPFCVWKIHQTLSSHNQQKGQEKASLAMTVLVLCGIRPDILSWFVWVVGLLQNFWQDFTLYTIVLVFWHLTIGLPKVFVEEMG